MHAIKHQKIQKNSQSNPNIIESDIIARRKRTPIDILCSICNCSVKVW